MTANLWQALQAPRADVDTWKGERHEDGLSLLAWVEVQFGDDDGKTKVERGRHAVITLVN